MTPLEREASRELALDNALDGLLAGTMPRDVARAVLDEVRAERALQRLADPVRACLERVAELARTNLPLAELVRGAASLPSLPLSVTLACAAISVALFDLPKGDSTRYAAIALTSATIGAATRAGRPLADTLEAVRGSLDAIERYTKRELS